MHPDPSQHAAPADAFAPEVVAAVTGHLNDDHPEDLVAIARVHGDVPDATAAVAVDVDRDALHLDVEVAAGTRRLQIAFPRRADERADLRVLLVELTEAAMTTQATMTTEARP
jgi:putative heme iron utilization protein